MKLKYINGIVNIVGIILTVFVIYLLSRFLLFFQEYVYKGPGEIFYGSEHLIVLAMGLGLLFLFIGLLNYGRISPNLYKQEKEENLKKGNDSDLDKILRVVRLGSYFLILFCLVFLGSFNNYIKLGDNYISASSWSWLPWSNEKQYSYSDAIVGYKYETTRYGRETDIKNYDFRFSDGKKVVGILHARELVNNIQQKQQNNNFNVSQPKKNILKSSWLIAYIRPIVSFLSLFLLFWLFKSFLQRKT